MGRTELRLGELSIEGFSRAGDETWFRVHPPGLAFDTGRGARELGGARDVFLTHGHLDHALGVPYVLSQRSQHENGDTRIVCPMQTVEPLAALIAAAERLEATTYRYDILGVQPGDRIEAAKNMTLEAFPVDHVVPGVGYHLIRHKRRLRAEYRDTPEVDLAAMRERGIDHSETTEEIALSYCGDTGPAVFDLEPRIFTSRVLLIECTFLDARQRAHGDRYKHLHLEDFEPRQDQFQNSAIVFHHLSRRHSEAALRTAVDQRLPALAGRVHLVVGST
jgi:ribonuclease Z